MPTPINPTRPIGGVPASETDPRSNRLPAKRGYEASPSGTADLSHQHGSADSPDAGDTVALDCVGTAELAEGA